MKTFMKAAALGAGLSLTAMSASAVVISTDGALSNQGVAASIIAAPSSVADDAPGAENLALQAFDEMQGVVLAADLDVDGPTDIAAGTKVNSHMIFLNSPGSKLVDSTATFTFDGIILGIMTDNGGTLEAGSNAFLGAAGTTYPGAFNNRGFEANNPDSASGVGTNTLTVRMYVTEPGDWMRVVTAVPLPASAWMLGAGLLGMGAFARRKKKAS